MGPWEVAADAGGRRYRSPGAGGRGCCKEEGEVEGRGAVVGMGMKPLEREGHPWSLLCPHCGC